MIEDIKKDAGERMDKSIASLRQELTKLRTGRAHTSLLDHVMVDYYGTATPLNQVSNVNVEDSRTLVRLLGSKDLENPWKYSLLSQTLIDNVSVVDPSKTVRYR